MGKMQKTHERLAGREKKGKGKEGEPVIMNFFYYTLLSPVSSCFIFVFALSQIVNLAGPTISEPGTG